MRFLRISVLLIALFAVLALIACNEGAYSDDAVVETFSLDLVKDGETPFTIIRPELDENEATIGQMKAIRDSFKENTGVRISMEIDWLKVGQEPDPEKYEILLGQTNRPESKTALEGLKYNDYVVKIVGNKIVINGYSPEAQQNAADYFINEILSKAESGSDFTFTSENNYVYKAEYPIDSITFAGEEIYPYSIVLPSDGDILKTEFANSIQQLFAKETGYYLPLVKDGGERSITIANADNRLEWNYKIEKGSLVCSASGIWVFEMIYDALCDIITTSDSLSLDEGWTVKGNLSDSDDEALIRSAIKDGDIRVMFHNVWFGDVHNRDELAARLYLSYLPDIIGLQEFEPGWYLSEFFDMISDEYKSVPLAPIPNTTRPNIVPILYRYKQYEVIDSGWYAYALPDESKAITWAVFKDITTGETFGVANTHFGMLGAGGVPERVEDATELAELVKEVSEKYSVPFIVGGDMNFRASSEQAQKLLEYGWINAHDNASVYSSNTSGHHGYPTLDEATATYSPSDNPKGDYSGAIDHAFVSGDLEIRVFETVVHPYSLSISDHLPIFVDVKFKD